MSGEAAKTNLKVKVVSSDGVEFELDEDVAKKSGTLNDMMQFTDSTQLLQEAVPIPYDGETLTKVFEWCEKNRGKAGRVKNPQDPRITLTDEENKYMDIPNQQLLQVLLAANYLNIGEMIEIITQKIANMAAGKNVEQMRRIYMLENDLTKEEEEEIRKKHAWCEIR